MPEKQETPMLTDVTIEGLRGVGRVELGFAPGQRVYTLFGVNGVGKTKCLEALYQFLLASNKEFAQNSWKQHGQASAVVFHSSIVMTRMSAKEETFEVPKKSADDGSFFLSHVWKPESAIWHSYPVIFLGAARRASLGKEGRSPVGSLGKFADRQREYFTALEQVLQGRGDPRNLGMSGNTSEWFVKRVRATSDRYKSKDSHEAEINAVLSMLHAVELRVDPVYLQIDDDDRVFLKVDGEERELDELSSGFASLLKLVQAIVAGYAAFTNEVQLQCVRGIVLIDEIDAHLHPTWQAKIIPCLKTLLPNTTFYIATHSPLVLTQLLEGEAYLLKCDNDGVVRSQMIEVPNRRLFDDVLEDTLGVDLSKLKLESMKYDDQTEAKQGLLSLLDELEAQEAQDEVKP
ncbi:hypothetical protein AGMMS50256_37710 [Betaproteobacteria bacterium]|nr:hypothetical protein AGMMS50256_37710 [Betaproteobacteria bacterium]